MIDTVGDSVPAGDAGGVGLAGPELVSPQMVRNRMAAGESFVVNVVTAWCPDCHVRQARNLPYFVKQLHDGGLDVLQLEVQKQRLQFLSSDHAAITQEFGGHGYPRTVLVLQGKIADADNVEVMTFEGLSTLGQRFLRMVQESDGQGMPKDAGIQQAKQ